MSDPRPAAGVRIASVTAEDLVRDEGALAALLRDAVESGASVGFLPPLDEGEAKGYWHSVATALTSGERVVLVARDGGGRVVGSAQLELAAKANARHRAEVTKVMVLRSARRQGIGRALMDAIVREAQRRGRTTLVLDTREGDPSERLYTAAGWERAGTIPRYARSADGSLRATAFYYRIVEGSATRFSALTRR